MYQCNFESCFIKNKKKLAIKPKIFWIIKFNPQLDMYFLYYLITRENLINYFMLPYELKIF